jgi:hypothetical protein
VCFGGVKLLSLLVVYFGDALVVAFDCFFAAISFFKYIFIYIYIYIYIYI